jgi:hypothetical protein
MWYWGAISPETGIDPRGLPRHRRVESERWGTILTTDTPAN